MVKVLIDGLPVVPISLRDNDEFIYGTGSNFRLRYNPTSNHFEITDGTNVLISFEDIGTALKLIFPSTSNISFTSDRPTWNTAYDVIEFADSAIISPTEATGAPEQMFLINAYVDSGGDKYKEDGWALRVYITATNYRISRSLISGSADDTITWLNLFMLDFTGALDAQLELGLANLKLSNATRGYLSIRDGLTPPSAESGQGIIYIDTNDGDLKIIFSDSTIKTIVTDT